MSYFSICILLREGIYEPLSKWPIWHTEFILAHGFGDRYSHHREASEDVLSKSSAPRLLYANSITDVLQLQIHSQV